jgi:hypothetical protein
MELEITEQRLVEAEAVAEVSGAEQEETEREERCVLQLTSKK